MRRREPVVEVGDGPPPSLRRFVYADWMDESERPPLGREGMPFPSWHHIRARRRYLGARLSWATGAGADYVATFHPEWSGGLDVRPPAPHQPDRGVQS